MVHSLAFRSASPILLPLALISLAVIGTTGCNLNQAAISSSTDTLAVRTLQGRVYGGQQPIVGATIQLYAAGTPVSGGSYGAGATALIASPPTTDSNGNFTITGDYTISTPSTLYIVATGGNSGTGNNPDIVLMAAIGGCAANSALSSSLFININEVTTAAAALEFASAVQAQPFIASPTGSAGAPIIGAPSTNYNDLRTAFENFSNLVNISTGDVVKPTGTKGKLIYTLADILASCVNSNPGSDSNCSTLFTDATPSGHTTAGDTFQAAWYIAQNPTNNVSALFGRVPPTPPFVALSSAPASFAITAPTDFVACFAVLGNSTVTNTGSTVVSGGDLGLSPGTSVTGFPPGVMTAPATQHITDSVAANGQTDLTAAYTYAQGLSCTEDLTGQDLGGKVLTPGVHCFSTSAGLTGTLTLDAQNNPDAVFIFQIGSTLTTASSSQVSLINGAQIQNVFWQVGSTATLGTSTAFIGTIMANQSVTLNTSASLQGRALAKNAAVTLDTNAVTAP